MVVDCDVLQADGGTRTAAVTGAYVALYQSLGVLVEAGVVSYIPLKGAVAAVSVGLVDGEAMLDLCYQEDVRAQVDLNIAITDRGELVEVQGGTEGLPFSRDILEQLISLAEGGMAYLFQAQEEAMSSLRKSA